MRRRRKSDLICVKSYTTAETYARLSAAAAQEGLSLSAFVQAALADHMRRRDRRARAAARRGAA